MEDRSSELLSAVLYPMVRVRAERTGGSGTVIYSQPVKPDGSEYETYVLTCHHVIDEAITVKDEWNPLVGRDRKLERRKPVDVEFFRYRHGSRAVGTYQVQADIEAWSRPHDIAILKLRSDDKAEHVARTFPHDLTHRINLLDQVYAVGCSLGHAPIVTDGRITSMSDEIEGFSYWMSTAQIIFGNSGGAMFHGAGLDFIGIPSRVAVYGWGSAVSHMGYFSDVERINKWLEEECFQFLYRQDFTPEQCRKLREEKKERELDQWRRTALPVGAESPRSSAELTALCRSELSADETLSKLLFDEQIERLDRVVRDGDAPVSSAMHGVGALAQFTQRSQ